MRLFVVILLICAALGSGIVPVAAPSCCDGENPFSDRHTRPCCDGGRADCCMEPQTHPPAALRVSLSVTPPDPVPDLIPIHAMSWLPARTGALAGPGRCATSPPGSRSASGPLLALVSILRV